jgi:hypothetical protein
MPLGPVHLTVQSMLGLLVARFSGSPILRGVASVPVFALQHGWRISFLAAPHDCRIVENAYRILRGLPGEMSKSLIHMTMNECGCLRAFVERRLRQRNIFSCIATSAPL